METRDWLLVNGTLFSAGWPAPRANWALAIQNGTIAWVGPTQEANSWKTNSAQVVDLQGKLLLPGFHDAHLHPMIGAIDLVECGMQNLKTIPEYLQRVRTFLNDNPHCRFVRGSGWLYAAFSPQGPEKSLLDAIVTDRPVFLKAIDGHSGWVNSKALEMAGINRDTPNPEGGVIEKDPRTGEPTGTLREWPAMGLVTNLFSKPGLDEYYAGAQLFLAQAARFGVTSLHDAMGKPPFLTTWERLEREGKLTVRVTASQFGDPKQGPEQIFAIQETRKTWQSSLRKIGSIKMFLDGVVEGRTALMLEPYVDQPGYHGEPIWDADHFKNVVCAIDQAGMQIHVHAVGDASVRLGIEAVELAHIRNGFRDHRHQITHLDLINPDDISRLAKEQIIANLQPAWYYRDSNFYTTAVPCLGRERAERQFPLRSLRDAGVRLAFSSDWPFGGDLITFNPLDGVESAITRRRSGGGPEDPLCPEQGVDLITMLSGFTRGSALADQADSSLGTLEAGKWADVIVLDRDLFTLRPEEIHQAKVLLTLLGGSPVWHSPEWGF